MVNYTNYVKFKNPYLSDVSKVSYLQRMVLIHSYLYYEMDTSVITDKQFDDICKQLCTMYDGLSVDKKQQTEYYKVFYDFDGSTGFHLFSRLDDEQKEVIEIIASHAPQRVKN